MFNSKFNGLLTVLLIIAIIGIIALIGYFGWSVYNKYYLNASARDAVDAFEQSVGNQDNEEPNENQNTTEDDPNRQEIGNVSETPQGQPNNSNENNNNTNTYYGYKILGTISIPKIDIKYPILEKATPKAIKVAVAYLSGPRNKQSPEVL